MFLKLNEAEGDNLSLRRRVRRFWIEENASSASVAVSYSTPSSLCRWKPC